MDRVASFNPSTIWGLCGTVSSPRIEPATSTENCDTYHCAKEKPKIELQYCLKNLVIQQVYYNYSTYKLLIGNRYTNP